MSRTLYVHIHIPKCAGTTFEKILLKNFGSNLAREGAFLPLPDFLFTADHVRQAAVLHPEFQCLSSHTVSVDLPYDDPEFKTVAMAFVRDPVDRFVSHYHFSRSSSSNWSPQAKTLSLTNYIELVKSGNLEGVASTVHTTHLKSQLGFLTGKTGEEGLARVKSLVAQDNLFLFPMKRFSDASIFLEQRFPGDFKDCALPEREHNVTKRNTPPSEDDLENIRSIVDPWDFQLHELCIQSFDKHLSKVYPSKEKLQASQNDFDERCKNLRNRKNRSRLFRSTLGGIRGAAHKILRT